MKTMKLLYLFNKSKTSFHRSVDFNKVPLLKKIQFYVFNNNGTKRVFK